MKVRPFENKVMGPSRHTSRKNAERFDLVNRFVAAVKRVKMWRRVFTEIKVDSNSKELTNAGHNRSSEYVLQQLAFRRQRTLFGEFQRFFDRIAGLLLDRLIILVA
jgi:hypothetical protein